MKSYRLYLKRFVARLTVGTLVTIAVPLVVALLVLRFYGLPDVAKVYLLTEIEKRHIIPFPIAVDRLLLDPTGAVFANRVTVFRDADRQSVLLQVDQVRGQFRLVELVARHRVYRQREYFQRRGALSGRAGRHSRFSRGERSRGFRRQEHQDRECAGAFSRSRAVRARYDPQRWLSREQAADGRAARGAPGKRGAPSCGPWTTWARSSRSTSSSSSRHRRAISAVAAPTSRSMGST